MAFYIQAVSSFFKALEWKPPASVFLRTKCVSLQDTKTWMSDLFTVGASVQSLWCLLVASVTTD